MRKLICACGEMREVGDDWKAGKIWACDVCKPDLFCDDCNALEYPLMCKIHEVPE